MQITEAELTSLTTHFNDLNQGIRELFSISHMIGDGEDDEDDRKLIDSLDGIRDILGDIKNRNPQLHDIYLSEGLLELASLLNASTTDNPVSVIDRIIDKVKKQEI